MNSNEARYFGLVYILLTAATGALSSESFSTCTRYTSFGYGYRDFFEFQVGNFSPHHVFYLEFYVKTGSDAHVLLKPDAEQEEGYEVVIGGGSNTFSQIREITPVGKATMITQKTDNFLSSLDYREFWISVDKLGIISVGKKENDEVFINWRFDNLLPVRVFAFGSWTNMKADWRFGCKTGKDSDSVREDAPASPVLRLKRDLFTLYDPNSVPGPDDEQLKVFVNFEISDVELHEKRGEIVVYGIGNLRWKDQKMKWNPSDYNGTESIYVPPFIIWTPRIRVLNNPTINKVPLFDLTAAGVMVKHDGSVFWRPPFRSVSSCFVDIENWPYDQHNCTIIFGFWMEPPRLILSLEDKIETLLENATKKWHNTFTMSFNTNEPEEEENFGIVYINLRRADTVHTTAFIVSYVAAVMMCQVSFWLPHHNSLKLHLRCGSLLLLVITLFLLAEALPFMGQRVPLSIKLYSWTIVITSVPIMLYVALKNVQERVQVPEWLSKILSNTVLGLVCCLPDIPQTEYENLNDDVDKFYRNRLMSLKLIMILERVFSLCYLLALSLLQVLI